MLSSAPLKSSDKRKAGALLSSALAMVSPMAVSASNMLLSRTPQCWRSRYVTIRDSNL